MAKQPVVLSIKYGGRWHDLTAAEQVYTSDPITVNWQRGTGTEPPPSTITATLDNRTELFDPDNPESALYGLAGRNTPIRVGMQLEGAITDAFGRTLSPGFGSADSGQVYGTLSLGGTIAAADYSVAGGFGLHSVPAANAYRLTRFAAISASDADLAVTFKCAQATGAQLEPCNIILRGTSTIDYVMCRVVVNTSNQVMLQVFSESSDTVLGAVLTAITHTGTGQPIRVRAAAAGNQIFMSAWVASGSEPASWQLVCTDPDPRPGWIGWRSGIAASNTNAKPVVFSYDDLAAEVLDVRLHGEIASWMPDKTLDFDPATPTRGNAWTTILAAGLLQRVLGSTRVLRSPAYREHLTYTTLGYWPGEDGRDATRVAAAAGNVVAASASGATFANGGAPAGSDPLFTIADGGLVTGRFAGGSTTTGWQVSITTDLDGLPGSGTLLPIFKWTTSNGQTWEIQVSNTIHRILVTAADGTVLETDDTAYPSDATPGLFAISYHLFASAAAGTVTWQAEYYAEGATVLYVPSGTFSASSVGRLKDWRVEGNAHTDGGAFGHVMGLQGTSVDLASYQHVNAFNGYPGELAGDRLGRVLTEENVPFQIIGDPALTMPMGPQKSDTLPDLLKEIESTEDALLFDSRYGVSLTMRTRVDRYDQAVALALTYPGVGLAPGLLKNLSADGVWNDVTAQQRDGASANAEADTGPMSVADPLAGGIGRYKRTVPVNLAGEDVLRDVATWWLAKGTFAGARYEAVKIDLVAAPSLAASVGAVRIGDLVTIAGIRADLVRLHVVGVFPDQIGSHTRTVTLVCVPEQPFSVAVYDDTRFRYDSRSSVLGNSYSTSALSFSVVTTDPGDLWTTDAAQYPQTIMVAGEVVTVSAVTGATSPQTFTLSARSVNGVVKAQTINTEVHTATPGRYAL